MHTHNNCGGGDQHAMHPHGCNAQPRPTPGKNATITPATIETSTCCGNEACSDGTAADDEGNQQPPQLRLRWQIAGMDCPACARKVEAAAMKVPGVHQARVLFTTQKLLVDAASDLTRAIEKAVTLAGFTLTAEQSPAVLPTPSFWRENTLLLAMVMLSALSAWLSHSHHSLGTIAFTLTTLIGVTPVIRSAWRSLCNGQPFTIEFLMSIAATGALFIGAAAEAAMVVLLFMIGERLEAFAAQRARKGVTALMALKPETAVRLRDGQRETVAIASLQPGNILVVPPGGRLPADGKLLNAEASFDESALTGESLPVTRKAGEAIMAGVLSVDALAEVQVTSGPGNSAIDRILQLIEQAENHRAPVERFIDRFSYIYTPLIMVLALLVAIFPPLLLSQPWHEWLYKGLTLLLIGCPCALVISTPAAITSALATASRHGMLIKGGAALEQLSRIRTLAFDKTGTLTAGKPRVTALIPLGELTSEQVLTISAAVEQGSTHPLAQAVVAEAQARQLTVPQATEQRALPGQGVEAWLGTERVALRSPASLPAESLNEATRQLIRQQEQSGHSVVVVAREAQAVGLIALRDQLREQAHQALAALRALGIHCVMLSGDNPHTAAAIASELGIAWRANLLPGDKAGEIKHLNQQQPVAMVGDGINDAPAMKAAALGIAMGSGSDVALETADAALTHNRLSVLPQMIELARATHLNIRQNITLALGLKAVFLLTTLLGITGLWLAVLADSGATALVTLNALRLLRKSAAG